MKTVFDNRMVAHVWAQQKQYEGRSHNGNLWFEGDTIYSYRTPIAKMYETVNVDGEKIALITTQHYSQTTDGNHKPAIRIAIKTIAVPKFLSVNHSHNLEYLVKRYEEEKEKLGRKRSLWGGEARMLLEVPYANLNGYCAAFGIETPLLNLEADIVEVEALHAAKEAKRNTPEYLEKQEKTRLAREKAVFEKEAKAREEWLNGGNLYWYGTDERGGTYLRVHGNVLETSQGANVPLDHAIKAFRFIAKVREKGEGWKKNGEQVRVGLFQIDEINSNGNIKAGCHRINWPEINRVAGLLGLTQ